MTGFFRFLAIAACLALPLQALADDGESQANSWGLTGEEKARFGGTVVDMLCELTGDCPDDCGAGARQMGIVRDDGVLVLAAKNTQTSFNGAIEDLLPYCGKAVEVDGLMVGEGAPRVYQVQFIREKGAEEWARANRWTTVRGESEPKLVEGEGPWFRRDPRVLEQIERNGYLGLGHETDEAFIKEWY